MEEVRAVFYGRVQGVNFRSGVVECAQRLGLVGRVWNREDGAVEVCAQGEREELEGFVRAVRERSGRAEIAEMEVEYGRVEKRYEDFRRI